MTGELSGLENGERLWLVEREAGIELGSGYRLDLIKRVLVDGEPVSLASFEIGQAKHDPAWKIPSHEISLDPKYPPRLATAPPIARSLDILAEPANWDADPDLDGLRFCLTPRDSLRQAVPVRGQLSVVLESRQLMPGPIHQRGDRARRVELQRWGRTLRAEDFGPEGLMVELPFEFRRQNLIGLGVPLTIKVRLGIPGQTVLEAVTGIPFGRPLSSSSLNLIAACHGSVSRAGLVETFRIRTAHRAVAHVLSIRVWEGFYRDKGHGAMSQTQLPVMGATSLEGT